MEEVKFKNTSKLNAQELSLFQTYAMKRTTMAMTLFFLIIFGGAGAGLLFVNVTIGIILIVCGVGGGAFFLPYLLKENQKRENIEKLGKNCYLNTFSFKESFIEIESQVASEGSKDYKPAGEEILYYKDIFKMVTYKDRLFLFVDQRQSYILHFNGMIKGGKDELIMFLKEKINKISDKTNI